MKFMWNVCDLNRLLTWTGVQLLV